MYQKEEILRLLGSRGIFYRLAEHRPVYTLEELAGLELDQADCIAKNLFLREDKEQYLLLMVPKEKRVDLKELRLRLGTRRLSLAPEEDLAAVLGLGKGEVTPLGALNDREHRTVVLLDAAFQGKEIGLHPNTNRATIWLRAEDLFRLLEEEGCPVRWLSI